MDLRKRVKSFMNDTGATGTFFCQKIGISYTYYYKWMRGEIQFSDTINNRITSFLDDVYTK